MGVREDKKRETRNRLERAALDLFERRGYDATTVDAVAARAGVSARTAFRYFPTKAHLVFGDAGRDLQALRVMLASHDVALPPFEAMRAALAEFSQRIGTPMNAERARVIGASETLRGRALEVRELWAEAVAGELAKRRGVKRPAERDLLGGLLVVAILVSAVRDWSAGNPRQRDLHAAVDRAASTAVEIMQPLNGED
jgi:AcrR family transcriptional regulator